MSRSLLDQVKKHDVILPPLLGGGNTVSGKRGRDYPMLITNFFSFPRFLIGALAVLREIAIS
jgi:hypothetical protein